MKLIKARMKGQRPRLLEADDEPQDGKVVDLMERLRQSLDSRTATRRKPKAARAPHAGKKKRSRQAA
jgi:non-homologous end joining protein Ku